MFLDVALESVRAVVLLGIVVFLSRVARDRMVCAGHGWNLIVGGFALLLFGSILDISDNFEGLNFLLVIGDTETEAFLEKFVGSLGRFIAIAAGLMFWIPSVQRRNFEISQRLQAEEALHESEERFGAIAEGCNVGIFITRQSDGTFLYVNAAGVELFGTTAEEIARKSIRDFYVDPEDRKALIMDLRRGPIRNRKLQFKKADGSTIWVLDSITWIKYRGEDALLSTVVDNTNGKLAEGALKEAHDTLDAQVKKRTSELRRANERLSEEIVTRKRAAEGLQKSESLLQTILDRIPAAIFLKVHAGKISGRQFNLRAMVRYEAPE